MSKRSKIENEPVELVDAEPIEAGDATLDLQRNSEGALVIEEQLSLAMSTIIDAAESRKRVARTGARRYNATRRDRMLVLAMLWSGSSHDDIAAALGMTRETMRNHFAVELDMGTKGLVADLVKSLTAQAMAGNVQAIDRLLRRWGGPEWREAISPSKGAPDAQVTVNVGEGAVAAQQRSAEDVERVIDEVARRAAKMIEGKG